MRWEGESRARCGQSSRLVYPLHLSLLRQLGAVFELGRSHPCLFFVSEFGRAFTIGSEEGRIFGNGLITPAPSQSNIARA